MSSQLTDSRTGENGPGEHAAPHPRGAGFRVLSRIARRRAEEDPDYLPRHRSDSEPDDVSAVG
jgi:hypothetical protein